jgi:two-component system, OmpR family, phosphate regulon sensor histidine kinase PhoR
MLKIHQLFLLKFVSLFAGTLLIASIISYITLKSIIVDYNEESLKNSIDLILLELEKEDDLDTLATKIRTNTGLRVTIVDRDGVVIAESNHDKADMENHANRFEIMQANSEPYGLAVRYSKTLRTDFLYVAKSVTYRGTPVTLRLSRSLDKVLANFYALSSRLVIALIFFVTIAFIISYNMSKKIHFDIAQIITYLEEIADKNYKAVIKTRYFSEFLQISLQLKNLVKKLENRERQKRKYTAKLRLVNKQRNDILSAISHEFKNPVASIMGYTETLIDDPEVDVKIRQKFLDKVLSNGKKISAMLDRLALSVKLENNDITLSKSDFDLCELSQEVVQNLSKKYRDRTITAECDTLMVHADKTTIEMVLVNLVDNALKYSEEKVTITMEGSRLMVVDRGMGIAEKELEKISSKFYRVEKNTWDNSLGLGLAIVSYILRMHHTNLMIESEVGEGSAFGFDITPLLPEETSS